METTEGQEKHLGDETYESISDNALRDALEEVDFVITRSGISAFAPARPQEAMQVVGELVGLNHYRMFRLYEHVRNQRTVPLIRTRVNKQDRTRFGPDGLRAFTALAYMLEKRGKENKWVGLEYQTRQALGAHRLRETINDPSLPAEPRINSQLKFANLR